MKKIDIEQYKILQEIYDYFNTCFFDNQLPEIVFTIDYRKSQSTLGYFHPQKLQSDEKKISIISLNPDYFDRENIEIISTLVHEMCHVWRWYIPGKKPANGYHDNLWSQKMQSIGLIPSSTGAPGGKKTGHKMSDYIEKHGLFEQKATEFIESHDNIFLFSGIAQLKENKQSNRNKIKYTCRCGQNIWGKPDLNIKCNDCNTDFTSYE